MHNLECIISPYKNNYSVVFDSFYRIKGKMHSYIKDSYEKNSVKYIWKYAQHTFYQIYHKIKTAVVPIDTKLKFLSLNGIYTCKVYNKLLKSFTYSAIVYQRFHHRKIFFFSLSTSVTIPNWLYNFYLSRHSYLIQNLTRDVKIIKRSVDKF